MDPVQARGGLVASGFHVGHVEGQVKLLLDIFNAFFESFMEVQVLTVIKRDFKAGCFQPLLEFISYAAAFLEAAVIIVSQDI